MTSVLQRRVLVSFPSHWKEKWPSNKICTFGQSCYIKQALEQLTCKQCIAQEESTTYIYLQRDFVLSFFLSAVFFSHWSEQTECDCIRRNILVEGSGLCFNCGSLNAFLQTHTVMKAICSTMNTAITLRLKQSWNGRMQRITVWLRMDTWSASTARRPSAFWQVRLKTGSLSSLSRKNNVICFQIICFIWFLLSSYKHLDKGYNVQ